jgi:hypothetical protein
MPLATITSFRDLVEIVVTAISLLGGAMALFSGWGALESIRIGQEPEQVAFRINRGLAVGFLFGLPLAIAVATLLAWI